jgi:hypothetical protein
MTWSRAPLKPLVTSTVLARGVVDAGAPNGVVGYRKAPASHWPGIGLLPLSPVSGNFWRHIKSPIRRQRKGVNAQLYGR